jgi:hypothetical protein
MKSIEFIKNERKSYQTSMQYNYISLYLIFINFLNREIFDIICIISINKFEWVSNESFYEHSL